VRYLSLASAAVALALVSPAGAAGAPRLSRQTAHRAAERWVREVANQYEIPFNGGLESAPACRRLSANRVSCRYALWLTEAEGKEWGLATAEWCPGVVEMSRHAGRIRERSPGLGRTPCQPRLPDPLPAWLHRV